MQPVKPKLSTAWAISCFSLIFTDYLRRLLTTQEAIAVAGVDLAKNFDIFSPHRKLLGLAL
ncbi:hypothetical protein [Nostoc sp.]|uniref:hypothetical protein n=1 Tax=Nostoc sp. TaxID=1180 RepID=UPI002FFCDC9D